MADPITGLSVAQLATQLRILGLDQIQNNDIAVDHVMAIDTPTQTYKLTVQQLSDFIEGVITELPNLTGYVDLTTAQDVAGVKDFIDFISTRAETGGLRIRSSVDNTIEGASAFDLATTSGGVTVVSKRNTAGDAWLPVIEINTSAHILMQQLVVCSSRIHMENNQEIRFANAAGATDGLGANRMLNGADDILRFQHHTGSAWTDVMSIQEDGDLQISAARTEVSNDSLFILSGIGNGNINDFQMITEADNITYFTKFDGTGQGFPVMQVDTSGNVTTSSLWSVDKDVLHTNTIPIVFKNAAGQTQAEGAYRILNSAGNFFAIEKNKAGVWKGAFTITDTGFISLADPAGVESAIVENAGTTTPNNSSIITREKGDARYAPVAVDINSADNGTKLYNVLTDETGAAFGLPAGWSVVKSGVGSYDFTHAEGHQVQPVVTPQNDTFMVTCRIAAASLTGFSVLIQRSENGDYVDSAFNMMVVI